jgi:hypothetical protein
MFIFLNIEDLVKMLKIKHQEAKMKREEKILKIKNYVREAIKEMGANYKL